MVRAATLLALLPVAYGVHQWAWVLPAHGEVVLPTGGRQHAADGAAGGGGAAGEEMELGRCGRWSWTRGTEGGDIPPVLPSPELYKLTAHPMAIGSGAT